MLCRAFGGKRRMERDEKAQWNQRYSQGSHGALEPDPLLINACSEFLTGAPPGLALDVAGGVGRHALWLAERGWRVKLVDISEVGLEWARKNAAELAAQQNIDFEALDLNTTSTLGRQQYDLVLVFFYLRRELFPALVEALKPGGFLICKTYSVEQLNFKGGPSHPMYLLEQNELLHAFRSLRILYYRETVKGKGVAELVAQKQNDGTPRATQ